MEFKFSEYGRSHSDEMKEKFMDIYSNQESKAGIFIRNGNFPELQRIVIEQPNADILNSDHHALITVKEFFELRKLPLEGLLNMYELSDNRLAGLKRPEGLMYLARTMDRDFEVMRYHGGDPPDIYVIGEIPRGGEYKHIRDEDIEIWGFVGEGVLLKQMAKQLGFKEPGLWERLFGKKKS